MSNIKEQIVEIISKAKEIVDAACEGEIVEADSPEIVPLAIIELESLLSNLPDDWQDHVAEECLIWDKANPDTDSTDSPEPYGAGLARQALPWFQAQQSLED
ncbi:MAG TPA: hypothetical protein V6C65_04035 [Allocoleopsis sp.]